MTPFVPGCYEGNFQHQIPDKNVSSFINMWESTEACFERQRKGNASAAETCAECGDGYADLRDYYNRRFRDDNGFMAYDRVCIDVQSRMNATFYVDKK